MDFQGSQPLSQASANTLLQGPKVSAVLQAVLLQVVAETIFHTQVNSLPSALGIHAFHVVPIVLDARRQHIKADKSQLDQLPVSHS